MSGALTIAALAFGAYLLGSVPFGLLIGRVKGTDLRAHGSGNIGATNAMRVLGKPLGIACFVLDVAKGAIPTALAGALIVPETGLDTTTAFVWVAIGVCAVIGHMFSIFLRFTGGKGVATGFGILLAIYPYITFAALAALAIWYATLKVSRYVSVASCVAACAVPVGVIVSALIRGDLALAWPFAAVTAALAAVVVWKHRGNITRIRAGTEHKVGTKKPATPST